MELLWHTLLYAIFVWILVAKCMSNCHHHIGFKCDSIEIYNSRFLDVKSFLNVKTKVYVLCCSLCTSFDKCASFNYDGKTHTCSLLSEAADETELTPFSTQIHGKFLKKDKKATGNKCKSRPCKTGQVCVTTTSGNGFLCLQGSKCASAPPVQHMTTAMGTVTMTSGEATYTCDKGYQSDWESGHGTCTQDKGWAPPERTCKGADCGNPPALDHQGMNVTSTLYPACEDYHCNLGYNRTGGNGSSCCQANGTWTEPSLKCQGINCGHPPALDALNLTSMIATLYPAHVVYTCATGYNRTGGNGSSSCQANGTWTEPSLKCEIINCGHPPAFDAQNVTSMTSTLYRDHAEYSCHIGYNRTAGNGSSSCQADGTWTEPSLKCEIINCGHPPAFDAQNVTSVTSTLYRDRAEYSCHIGYNRTAGNGSSSCQANGSWSVPTLKCQAIDCGSPIPPSTNALMQYNDTTFKYQVQVRCVNQTSFYGGNSTGECKENGKWVGISGSCLLDMVHIDDWTLVFRATADIGQSLYDLWMNDALYNDFPVDPKVVKPECISLTTSPKCDMHYKSKIITIWEAANIDKVKVLLLKKNEVRRELLFNGTDTNKTNWFSPSHLINSSWEGLDPSTNFASFQMKSALSRVFDITGTWIHCAIDPCWMLIVDKRDKSPCWWDNINLTPKIIYHINPTVTEIGDDEIAAFNRGYEYGDAMAVLVKCKNVCQGQ